MSILLLGFTDKKYAEQYWKRPLFLLVRQVHARGASDRWLCGELQTVCTARMRFQMVVRGNDRESVLVDPNTKWGYAKLPSEAGLPASLDADGSAQLVSHHQGEPRSQNTLFQRRGAPGIVRGQNVKIVGAGGSWRASEYASPLVDDDSGR